MYSTPMNQSNPQQQI
jgi:hypothetical protein